MIAKIVFIIGLLVYPFHIYGQSHSGRVIDNQGSPIKGVIVINTSRPSADETDKEGRFTIHAEDGDSLLISVNRNSAKCVYSRAKQDITINRSRSFYDYPLINEEIINLINTLYLSEKYRDCIACCRHYIGYRSTNIISERHPYRNWEKINRFSDNSNFEDVATLYYLGCISAYQYSLTGKDIFENFQWARACVALYDDYIQENIPQESWSAEKMYKYLIFGERGLLASQCGEHFLKAYERERWVKSELKKYEKIFVRISDALYTNTLNKDLYYADYPIIQYKINTIEFNHAFKKGDYKVFKDVFSKRRNALIKLIQQGNQYGNYRSEIHIALSSLTSMLCTSVIENDICKKIGNNFERFCMEELIRLQDISYYLNGSSRYSLLSNYTLRDIQNRLNNDDCVIMHFEAPIASGRLYSRFDLGTRYRNYALIVTKNQERPDVWHRGYISDSVVNDLNTIKERYQDAKRFFFVGTPRMSFIDIAGNDSSIVRLHSLSQLLQDRNNEIEKEITFIGDINYWKVGNSSLFFDNKGEEDDEFGRLTGPAEELKQIKLLFENVHPLCGDDATRNSVMNAIRKSKGIVHISTHGSTNFNSNYDFEPEDLILKRNIMDNSRLILSGYNDNPNSYLSYLSGSDVLRIKKIDTSIIFLDACLSGRGAVGAAGSVGITEAFHMVGAQNIICYLERVKDELATKFSNKFYLELSKGSSCHDAFFTAKKSVGSDIKVVLWE